ncbi:MAG: response regulator [Phycisphaeraceae bacterium]|nr:response regulator [Phycisphaeraceae bacterium]
MKLLLVDDETGFLGSLTRFLTRRGIRVYSASSVESALEVAVQVNPDVVLIDLLLGSQSDGLDLADSLRRIGQGGRLIVMSGLPEGRILKRIQEDEHITFIPKPFTPDELLDLMSDQFPAASP